MKQFNTGLIVVLGTILVLWSGAASAQSIWWETGMVKLRQANSGTAGDPVPAGADICSSAGCAKGGVAISAARNEFEPFQILIAAPSASGVSGVNVTVSDLKSAQGNVIVGWVSGKPKNIVIYREHYLSIDSTKLSSTAALPGLWPDALVPKVDEYFGEVRRMPTESGPAFPFYVAPNQKQGIWVDVYVPLGTPAGVYTGTAQVTIGSAIGANIPVNLTVREFDLPSTPTLKTAYGLGVNEAKIGHYGDITATDSQYWEIVCLYTKEMLMHRVSNETVIWPRPQWSSWQGKIDWSLPAISTTCNQRYPEFLSGTAALPNGKLPGAKVSWSRMTDGTGGSSSSALQTVSYYKDYIQHFASMGWKSQLYYYLWDEPPYPGVNGKRRCDLNYNLTPSTAWAGAYNKSKFFKDNALDIPIMITTNKQSFEDCFVNFLGVSDYNRYIDIWTVPNKLMDGKPTAGFPFNVNNRKSYDSIITGGKQLWWYHGCGNHGCAGSETGLATPMADLPAIYSRMFQWLTYNYSIGYSVPGPGTELYFETVYSYKTENDPWKNIYYFTGNGDGTYFYPGRPDKIGGTTHIPIASIRLKMLREGIEDYEYLALVEAKKNKEGTDGKGWIKINILDPYLTAKDPKDGVMKMTTYNWNTAPGAPTSATGLFRAREELAKALSSAPSSPDFTFASSSAAATVLSGGKITATLTVSSLTNSQEIVALSCSAPGLVISCSLNPNSVTLGPNGTASSILDIITQTSTPSGVYPLVITGISASGSPDSMTHQVPFTLTVLPISYSDTFDRPNAAGIGPQWNEYLRRQEIFGNQVRTIDTGGHEALFLQSVGVTQSISADCKMTAKGNSCGVMARWSDANNFYYTRIDAGLGNISLMKRVKGVFIPIATANRTMTYNTYYKVRLVTKGSTIAVYFGSETSPAISLTDTSLSIGGFAGLRSYTAGINTVGFDNFLVTDQ